MGTHNPNGRGHHDENRPSWRPQDQNQGAQQGRESRLGFHDEQEARTDHYGQGQSGYGAGRHENDRSYDSRNQSGPEGHGRYAGNTDDRWSGRGGASYYEDRGRSMGRGPDERMGRGGGGDRYAMNRGDRGWGESQRNMGGDFDADYNSGYNRGGMGYGGYGMSGPQQGMGAGQGPQGFRGGSGGAQMYRDDSQGHFGRQDRGISDGHWGREGRGQNQPYQSYGNQTMMDRDLGRGGYRGGESYGGNQSYNTQGYTADVGYGQGYGGSGSMERGSGMNDRQGRPSHRGKGPVGWQRSDERIRETICEMLHEDDDIDASRIEVSVKDGDVTLGGSVTDRSMKRAAEDLVERCSGVKDVQNNIRVGPPQTGSEHTGAPAGRERGNQNSPQASKESSSTDDNAKKYRA